jgi:hypothetical protein
MQIFCSDVLPGRIKRDVCKALLLNLRYQALISYRSPRFAEKYFSMTGA